MIDDLLALPEPSEITLFPMVLISLIFLNRYIFGYFFLLFQEHFSEKKKKLSEKEMPTVCVMVPLYNEGAGIQNTISTIQRQTYPDYLLTYIIVDDRSTDSSFEMAKATVGNDPKGRVVQNPVNMGKRRALVRATQMTDAEIVVSVDSDVTLAHDAVEQLVSCFENPKIAAVGGRVNVNNANQNWLTMMQTVKYYIGYELLKGLENSFGSVMCLSGCLTAYRRKVLIEMEPKLITRRLGRIRIKYGEDRYLTRLIVQAGYKTHLYKKAVCFTKAPTSLAGYFSQQLRWRRSNLVDFIGGVRGVLYLHPVVAMHYLSLGAVLIIYPMYVLIELNAHSFGMAFIIHLFALTLLGVRYWVSSRELPSRYRVPPATFFAMSFMLPVTYLLLTPLALMTLDTGSWETRKKSV